MDHVTTRDAASPGLTDVQAREAKALLAGMRTRVVRESGRDTWFVVNESGADIDSIPIELDRDRPIRRVHVNSEVAEFAADDEVVAIRPQRPLRAGAGTIVVVHYR